MDERDFIEAVAEGREDEVRDALRDTPALASARDVSGVSVIARAVYAGRRDLAVEIASRRRELDVFEAACVGDVREVARHVKASPGAVDAVSPDGFSPLGFAAFFGHLELTELLLASGARVDVAADNPMRVQPLHSAAAHSDPATATAIGQLLLEAGADPNATQQKGFAPLHEAALNGNMALAGLLLEFGANPTQENEDGETPIQLAVSAGHAPVASVLATHAGVGDGE